MKTVKFILLILLVSIPLFPNGQQDKMAQVEKKEEIVTVFTSILPQKYFVERIGGDRVDVNVLVGPGKSPATYEPTPGQVVTLSGSDIFFAIGVPFENAFIPTIRSSLENLRIIDTSEGIEKRVFNNVDKQVRISDPHIWMSPRLVKIQAATILDALVESDPDGGKVYIEGYNSFMEDLDSVYSELKNIMGPLRGNTIFVYHPAFGYLFDEFGLEQMAIETGGKEPSPSVLEEIITKALKKR